MAESAVDDFRLEPRRGPGVGAFELLVALGALGDLATTTFILLTGRAEANVVLSKLAAVDPWLAVATFWAFGATLVGACWFGTGWIARIAGAYTLVSMGVAGVLNVALYTTGVYLYPFDPTWYIHYGAPVLGVALGTAWSLREGNLPWRHVAAAGCAFVVAAWVLPFAF